MSEGQQWFFSPIYNEQKSFCISAGAHFPMHFDLSRLLRCARSDITHAPLLLKGGITIHHRMYFCVNPSF